MAAFLPLSVPIGPFLIGLVPVLQQRRPLHGGQTARTVRQSERQRDGGGERGSWAARVCVSLCRSRRPGLVRGTFVLSRHSRAPSHRSCCCLCCVPGSLLPSDNETASVRSFCIYLFPRQNKLYCCPSSALCLCVSFLRASFFWFAPSVFFESSPHTPFRKELSHSLLSRLFARISFCFVFSPISFSTFHFLSRVWRRISFSSL